MKVPHDNPNQYRLDYESAENERRVLLAGALAAAGATKLQQLADLVYQHQASHQGQPLEAAMEDVAIALSVSRATAKRRIASLVQAGILHQERRPGETSRLEINWQVVRTIARGRGGHDPPQDVVVGSGQVRSAQVRSGQVIFGGETSSGLTPIEKPPSYLPQPHPPAPLAIPVEPAGDRPWRIENLEDGWREVGKFLWRKLKVGLAAQGVACFQAAGGTLEELQAIVDYAVEHGAGTYFAAWGPGAIYQKLRHWERDEPLDVGWPEPSEVYERHRRHQQQQAKYDRDAAERDARRREQDQDQATPDDGPGLFEQYQAAIRAKAETPINEGAT